MKLADLLPKPIKMPKTGVLEGALLRAARAIEPGKGVRLESEAGESYVLIRTEDFEHIAEMAGMRVKVTADTTAEPK